MGEVITVIKTQWCWPDSLYGQSKFVGTSLFLPVARRHAQCGSFSLLRLQCLDNGLRGERGVIFFPHPRLLIVGTRRPRRRRLVR